MALPFTRNHTYVNGEPPRSSDLNSIQDWIKAFATGNNEPARVHRFLQGSVGGTNQIFMADSGTGDQYWAISAGNPVRVACAPLCSGDNILAIGMRATMTASGLAELRFWRKTSAAAAPIQVGPTVSLTSGSSNLPTAAISGGYKLTATDHVYAVVNVVSAGVRLYDVCALVSHPPA
jgi:hypothetical protein